MQYHIQSNDTISGSNSEYELMSLADNMAQAATVFQGQGYEAFIQARENFKTTLHEIITKLNKQ